MSFRPSFRLSVSVSATTHHKAAKKRYQQLQCYIATQARFFYGDFLAFKKLRRDMLMSSYCFTPRPVFGALHTVEASGSESKAAFN